MTVAEAMARACAVIVPSQGPFGEFVDDGVNGSMYDLGRPMDAAAKIESLLKDDELRKKFGIAGREYILEHYGTKPSLHVLIRELMSLIENSIIR
jgi:glycosyltransferase involved in cell wall biosynthesis